MKHLTLSLITLITLTSASFGAQVICGSTKASHKRTYPINDVALKVAASLGLKACTGTSSKRFSAEIKRLKHTGKFIVISSSELSKAKAKLIKMGGSNGPSF